MKPQTKRIVQLDGIRAVAIASVFIHYAFHVPLLWMGVDLFFILSGFLITGVLVSGRDKKVGQYFGHFYERRARRILPPYLVLLIAVSLVFGLSSWVKHWYLYLFMMNVILAKQLSQPDVMVILWSLAVEEQFYLIWPFAVKFLSERALGYTAATLLVVAPLLRWFCTPLFANEWYIYALTPFRMDCLAAGALLAILWRNKPALLERYGAYGLILPPVGLAVSMWFRHLGISTHGNSRVGNTFIYELTLLTCFGVMVWALSGKFVGVLRLKPLVYLGRISYTVYLMHLFFLKIGESHLHNRFAVAGFAAAAVVLFATVSWYAMERPLLEGRSRRRAAPQAEKLPAEEPAQETTACPSDVAV